MVRKNTSEKDLAAARKIYDKLCLFFPGRVKRNDEQMLLGVAFHTGMHQVEVIFDVDADCRLIRVTSYLFAVEPDRTAVTALAVNYCNVNMINGCFAIDYRSRNLFFRINESFAGNTVGNETIRYLLNITAMSMDMYKKPFFLLSEDTIDLDEFARMVTRLPNDSEGEQL